MENIIKNLNIFQLGNGNVGKVVIQKIFESNKNSKQIRVSYFGIADSTKYLFDDSGLSIEELNELETKSPKNIKTAKDYQNFDDLYSILKPYFKDLIIVDTTATNEITPFLMMCAQNKCKLVLANKKPLAEKLEDFLVLNQVSPGCRATIGAGLPLIPILKRVLANGEDIKKIEGCFSGSMGILASELEKGKLFSDIINESVERKFTEPDPRVDLAGKDLANKILILARISGIKVFAEDIQTEKLYPTEMENITKDDFLLKCSNLNELFAQKYQKALKENCTYKFMAIYEHQKCRVIFNKISLDSDFGKLKNSDKMAIITTNKQKIIVKGRGSGANSAAQDVLNDIIHYK